MGAPWCTPLRAIHKGPVSQLPATHTQSPCRHHISSSTLCCSSQLYIAYTGVHRPILYQKLSWYREGPRMWFRLWCYCELWFPEKSMTYAGLNTSLAQPPGYFLWHPLGETMFPLYFLNHFIDYWHRGNSSVVIFDSGILTSFRDLYDEPPFAKHRYGFLPYYGIYQQCKCF